MLNSVMLQLLIAGNMNSMPIDHVEVKSLAAIKCASALPDSDSMIAPCLTEGDQEPDPKDSEGDTNDNNDLKKQIPSGRFDKKRVSDLNPIEPNPLLGGWVSTKSDRAILLAADHAEHDPNSPTYSGRHAPGPVHGPDPHGPDIGDDPNGEVHNDPYNGASGWDPDHPNRPYPKLP